MKMPTEFKLVTQPPRSRVCGAAVCAMAVDKTLEEVVSECDWRELTYPAGMARYLARHGVTLGLWFTTGPHEGASQVEFDPAGRPAIVAVKSNRFIEADHWVFWDGAKYLDPTGEQDGKYDVLECWYLAYHQEPDWMFDLPEDWKAEHNYSPVN